MSDKSIRAALEERLDALLPALATQWENIEFSPPAANLPYQRVHMMRAQPENPEAAGSKLKRHLGVMQVTLMYPQNVGPGDAETRAAALSEQFKRGTSLTKDGVTVTVDGTPHVMAGFQDGDRWAVPVRIPYFSNVMA